MSAYVDKPVKDRTKAFFPNEGLADVHFLVGIEDIKVSNSVIGVYGCRYTVDWRIWY